MSSSQMYKSAGMVKISVICQAFARRHLATTTKVNSKPLEIIDPPDNVELETLNYDRRRNDPIHIKRARLIYQSRKRGMLENGLLLSTFADKYLNNMNEVEIDEYDKIINLPSNDWDIFYWAMGMKPTPVEFDNPIMNLLKEHVKNAERELRTGQPELQC